MKKVFFVNLFMGIFLLLPFISLAQWNNCPHGKTGGSGEYPGECGLYVDTNDDKICDHSQKQLAANTINKKNNLVKGGDAISQVVDNTDKQEIVSDTKSNSIRNGNKTKGNGGILPGKHKKKYPFSNIVVVLSILYTITYLLAKRKVIRMITHKKIWNILLTFSFLALAITSILLMIQINSGKIFSLGFNILYWHVITGIVMMVITLFHMGWHWRYYKNLFK